MMEQSCNFRTQRNVVNRRVPRSYVSPFIKKAETLARARAAAAKNHLRSMRKSKDIVKEWDNDFKNNGLFDPSIKKEDLLKQERKLRAIENKNILVSTDKIPISDSKLEYNSTHMKHRKPDIISPHVAHTFMLALSVDSSDDDSASINNTFSTENHVNETSTVSRPTSPIDETYIKYLMSQNIYDEIDFLRSSSESKTDISRNSSSSVELCNASDDEQIDDFPLVDNISDYKPDFLRNQTSNKLESYNVTDNSTADQLNIALLLEKFTNAIDKMQEIFVSSNKSQTKDTNSAELDSGIVLESASKGKAIEISQYNVTDIQESKPSSKDLVMDILIENARLDKRKLRLQKSEDDSNNSVTSDQKRLLSTGGSTVNSTEHILADTIVTKLPTNTTITNVFGKKMNTDLKFESAIFQSSIGRQNKFHLDVPFTTPAASKTHETSIVSGINSNANNAEYYLATLLDKNYTRPIKNLARKEKIRILSNSLLPKVCITHEATIDFKSYKARYRNSRRLRDMTFNSNGTSLKLIVDVMTDKIQCGIVNDIISEIESILNNYTKTFLNKI